MKVVVLRSDQGGDAGQSEGKYLQRFNTRYAKKVAANLRNAAGFCVSCGPDCIFCRKPYNRKHGRDIAAIISLPAVLPYLLENPAQYVPRDVPAHDVLLVIHIHEQILLEILKHGGKWGTRGVVVPLEAPDWISGSARAQARAICKAEGIEIAFPKPFCSFNPPEGGVLARFRRHFHIGRPDVELVVKDGRIARADVKVSAACGATYHVARWLIGRKVTDNLEVEVIAKRISSYPCTASMDRDPELDDDTPMHAATIAHRDILLSLQNAGEKQSASAVARPEGLVATPLGKLLPKPTPAKENQEGIETAKKLILDEIRNHSSVTFDHLRKKTGDLTSASLISALLLLKKEGHIRSQGGKALKEAWFKVHSSRVHG
ncbi:MAG: hypothetical protein HY360_01980 [Verrucomicrobia bacterium]|nr:hypothetical protein [Verrucomicrobiota bacterium]